MIQIEQATIIADNPLLKQLFIPYFIKNSYNHSLRYLSAHNTIKAPIYHYVCEIGIKVFKNYTLYSLPRNNKRCNNKLLPYLIKYIMHSGVKYDYSESKS